MSEENTQAAATTAEVVADTTVDAQEDAAVEATETQVEVKAEPEKDSFAKFRKPDGSIDADKLSKSYSQLEKAYHKRPQAPAASVEEYSFDFGEGFQVDEERTSAFKEAALAKGVTKEQYAWLMETYSKNLPGQSEPSGTWTAEKTQKALEAEWGADFQHNAVIARKAFDTFAPSDADLSDPVWNHPAVMKLLARMGGELAEDSIAKRPSQAAGESVRQQIDALRAEPDYMSNPAKQAQMLKLYEKLG